MKTNAKVEPMFLRVSAAAVALNMSPVTVYELVRKGVLPSVKMGGTSIRIPVAALRKFADDAIKGAELVEAKG